MGASRDIGNTVTLRSTAAVNTGAVISSVYPQFSSVALNGTFGFHASASGEFCVGGCVQGSIFTVDAGDPVYSGQILSLSRDDLTLIQGLGLGRCFGAAEAMFGAATYPNSGNYCENPVTGQDNGYLAFPDVQLGPTVNDAVDASASASGSQEFMVLPISAVKWLGKLASLPAGFPNLNATFDGIGVSYTLLDNIVTAVATEHQTLTFDPSVDVTLDFGQPLSYTVKDSNGNQTGSATGSTATFPLGDSIDVVTPATAFQVTPTVSMGSAAMMTNHTWDTISGAEQFRSLRLTAHIPRCCLGIFPGLDINLGPVYDSGAVPLGSAPIERADRTWPLAGFSTQPLTPISIVPHPLPVPTGTIVDAVEGAGFTGVAGSFHDPDPADTTAGFTAVIDWGDGTTSPGVIAGTVNSFTVTGTHTYAEEGTYAVKATVTDTDIPTVHATANSTARVADAPLRSTGLTNGRLAVQGAPVLLWPGSGNAVLAHFTDDDPQGTPSDYTAVVDWGDGTQSPAVVTEGPAGGFDVTGNHVYASQQLGVHTVVIDVTDAGGSATQATTTVLAYGYSSGGTFAIGDESPGLFPGSQGPDVFSSLVWSLVNRLSGGIPFTTAFEGFVTNPPANPAPPATVPSGTSFTAATGPSVHLPASVPAYMLVLVTSQVRKLGRASFTGIVSHWVVVRVLTYRPAFLIGNGTIVSVLR